MTKRERKGLAHTKPFLPADFRVDNAANFRVAQQKGEATTVTGGFSNNIAEIGVWHTSF